MCDSLQLLKMELVSLGYSLSTIERAIEMHALFYNVYAIPTLRMFIMGYIIREKEGFNE